MALKNTAEKSDDVNNATTEESTEHARSLPDLFVQSKQHSDNVRSVEMMKGTTPESSRAAQQPQVPPRPRFFKLQRTRTKDLLPQTVSEPGFIAPRVCIRIAFALVWASRNPGSEHSSSLKSHTLKSRIAPRHASVHPHGSRPSRRQAALLRNGGDRPCFRVHVRARAWRSHCASGHRRRGVS